MIDGCVCQADGGCSCYPDPYPKLWYVSKQQAYLKPATSSQQVTTFLAIPITQQLHYSLMFEIVGSTHNLRSCYQQPLLPRPSTRLSFLVLGKKGDVCSQKGYRENWRQHDGNDSSDAKKR